MKFFWIVILLLLSPLLALLFFRKNGMESWIHGWKKNGWKTAAKQPVKNEDLWRELDRLCGEHDIVWRWVKGHAGHTDNERADALANRGAAASAGRVGR